MMFMPAQLLGLSALLTTLGARVRCRENVIPVLYPNPSKAPPPSTDAELRRFRLAVGDGPS